MTQQVRGPSRCTMIQPWTEGWSTTRKHRTVLHLPMPFLCHVSCWVLDLQLPQLLTSENCWMAVYAWSCCFTSAFWKYAGSAAVPAISPCHFDWKDKKCSAADEGLCVFTACQTKMLQEVMPWNRLSNEVVESPPLEVFTEWHPLLLCCWWVDGWTGWP